MAASFAGAKSQEGRRRRRLVAGADEPAAPKRGAASAAPAKGRRRSKKGTAELRATRFPLKKLISRHRWKIWAAGLLLALPILGLRAAAMNMEQVELRAGPAIASLLNPADARLARAYSGILLLAASQLCVMIYWVRSKSPADFGGRFGVWLFGAAACFLFATCVSTDAHLVFAQTVIHFRMVHFPTLGEKHTEALCWLAPTGLFGAALVRSILSDMRKCPSSFLTLSLAVLCWGGGVFLRFENQYTVRVPDRELIAPSLVMAGHVWLTLSMLLHARFVLFESAAPPVEKPASNESSSSSGGLFARLFARKETAETDSKKAAPKRASKPAAKPAKKPAKTGKESSADEEDEEEEEDEEALTAPTPSKPAANEPKPVARPVIAQSTARPEPQKSSSSHSKPAESRPQAGGKPTFTMPSASRHNDEEDDEEDEDGDSENGPDKNALKGLSKRERRKLQKQWREDQRTGRAA